MPKRKSKLLKEQELIKKCKTKPCSINMALFNPALWIYNYTIDKMKKRDIQLDSDTIIRKMNRCYNAKKPILPITYINREDIYKVIGGAAEFLEISNVETMILEYFPEAVSDKRIKSKSKSIYKMLTTEEFRKTELFNRIKINCKVVYETLALLYCDTDSLKPSVNRKITDHEIEGNNSLENDIIFEKEINTIFLKCHTQKDFLECTNVEELAKKEIIKLGLNDIDQLMKNTLIDIIISNTWKRLNHIVLSLDDGTLRMQSSELNIAQSNKESLNDCETLQTQSSDLNVTEINKDLLLHRYALERIREVKHNPDDTNTIIRIKAQLVNYDKCLIPLSYLEHSEFLQIFPNLFSFIKFTNILKVYGIQFLSLRHDIMKRNKVVIRCIKNEALHVFEKIRNDPDFRKEETYQKILVNSKFLFNQNRISSEDGNTIDDEIVEYFKKIVPHDNIAKLKDQVNMNSSTDSNNSTSITRSETRHRVKVLNQIQAKLNVITEDRIEEETADSEVSSNSDSLITVINFNPTNNIELADQQTIVVPEFSTQPINLVDPSNSLDLNKIPGLKKKSSIKPYQQGTSDSQDLISCLASTSNYTELEVLPSNDEILTIDDSPTKSQRIQAFLDSSPANLSDVPSICYKEVVAKSDKIVEMRGQNCRKPLSKNPELEIPVMRNNYSSLPVKNKK